MTESFKDRLNFLFATKLSPDGDEYSLREVSSGTGGKISPAYLQKLRTGGYENPSRDKVKALADFFGVPQSFFYDNGTTKVYVKEIDKNLKEAILDPKVKEIALRAMGTDEQTKALIIHLLKKTKELSQKEKRESTKET